jgi:tryptophan synthase beta chain
VVPPADTAWQIRLGEEDVPTAWYNLLADLPFDLPEPRPGETRAENGHAAAKVVAQLPLSMYRQGTGRERFIEIPDEVRNEYKRWRPTTLFRARRLEQELVTPAHIYYKYEGSSPSGSHKPNTAIAQAYYYRNAGIKRLTTGTGAGQWGTALAAACQSFGLGCTVFMVRCSFKEKPLRRVLMQVSGAEVIESPSMTTAIGRQILRDDPDCPGSMAIANAEAIEYARATASCRFAVGSGENHVLLHQTVIGEEALQQMAMVDEYPDVVIGSTGAGSNFAGLAFPFLREKLRRGRDTRFVAVEPAACPKLTRGEYTWDYSDVSALTPMLKMYTLGNTFIAPSIHAGGLRYHGAAPLISALYDRRMIEAVAYPQTRVFEAGIAFARLEGIIPAPESMHAIKCAIDEAMRARIDGAERIILFNLSGHGLLDLSAYDEYLSGRMTDAVVTDEEIAASLQRVEADAAGRPG